MASKVRELIKECWDSALKKRPTFERICLLLRTEHQQSTRKVGVGVDSGTTTRSMRLAKKSERSVKMHMNKCGSSDEMATLGRFKK